MPFHIATHMDSLRDNLLLRILRGLQLLFAIVVLGVSAAAASDWQDLGCNIPRGVAYNIAAAVITFIVLLYLIAATGVPRINILPWHHFIQLGLDVFLLILWIASTATASLNCQDSCTACRVAGLNYDTGCGFIIYFGGDYCNCFYNSDAYTCPYPKDKRAILDARSVFDKRASSSRGGTNFAYKGISRGSKLGVNVIEFILFVVSTTATVYFIFLARRGSQSRTHVAPTTAAATAPAAAAEDHKMEHLHTHQQPVPSDGSQMSPPPAAHPPQHNQPVNYPSQQPATQHSPVSPIEEHNAQFGHQPVYNVSTGAPTQHQGTESQPPSYHHGTADDYYNSKQTSGTYPGT